MDPLGRCIAVYVIFLLLAAFFSASAAALNTLRSLDGDEAPDSAASRLWAHKNLYRYRLCAAAAICAAICAGAAALAPHTGFLSLFPEALGAFGEALYILAAALPTAFAGVLLPWALGERFATPDSLYSSVVFAKNLALVLTFVPEGALRLILRAAKIEPDEARNDVTEREILNLVDEGESSGAIDSEKREMIENIFDFSEHTVREIMTHYMDVAAIKLGASDGDIVRLISETGYSRYPVYSDDKTKVIGVLIAKEYLCDRLAEHPKGFEALLREPMFVPDNMQTDEVLRRMKDGGVHMAIVVNEYGEALGTVTMEDILEEIVGSIYDETDTADDREPEAKPLGGGAFDAPASLPLDELGEALGVQIPQTEGIDTVGALVFSKLTTIPDDGVPIDVEAHGLMLHSDGLCDRRLENVIVRVKPTENDVAPAK